MNISYTWLKDLVEFDLTPDELGHRLTMAGLEVDATEIQGVGIENIVVGQVITKEKHPQADKLSVCTVNVGDTETTIVCGASNVAAGQMVPVALSGTTLPDGMKIKPVKLRGILSNGMICSEEELGLAASADGIMVLPNTLIPGTRFIDALPVQDWIYDFDLTPNRPDCFSHEGIAREVHCLTGGKLTFPVVSDIESTDDSGVALSIESDKDCYRYAGRVVRGITVAESPFWLKRRLQAIGLRPINNIVDVTNYVLHEMGHPLHAFDLATLENATVRVRRASKNEKLVVIDGTECELDEDILVVADSTKPIAIAGVMGGKYTEVTDTTVDIFIESAYFHPTVVRKSARKLGLSTDASLRFERGMDPNRVIAVLNRTVELILQVAGGSCAGATLDVQLKHLERTEITLRGSRIQAILGMQPSEETVTNILTSLECLVHYSNGVFAVQVPTFRVDLAREIDLIEEIARVYGYDNIECDMSATGTIVTPRNTQEEFINRCRTSLVASGLYETITSTLVRKDDALRFAPEQPVDVINTVSSEMDAVRSSIAVSMLPTVGWNINHGAASVRFFETGKVFCWQEGKPVERRQITIMLSGNFDTIYWGQKSRATDFYDLKGIIEVLCDTLGIKDIAFTRGTASFLEDEGVVITKGKTRIGVLGTLTPKIRKQCDIKQSVLCAVLEVVALQNSALTETQCVQPPKFPALHRDISLLVDAGVPVVELQKVILKKGKPLVREVIVLDEYTNDELPTGKRSLTFSLQYRSDVKTLRDKDVKKIHTLIVKTLQATFDTELR